MSTAPVLFDRRLKASKDYWLARLAGGLPAPVLSDGGAGPAGSSRRLPGRPSRQLAGGLQRLVGDSEFLAYAVVMAALQVCLARLAGTRRVVVASPPLRKKSSRPNALGILADIDPEDSFRSLLVRTRATLLEAYEHQDYPWDLLSEDLGLAEGDGAFFDVALSSPGVHGELPPGVAPRVLHAASRDGAFTLDAEIRGGRAVDARRLVRRLQNVLERALADVELRAGEIELLSPAERHQVLREWNSFPRPEQPGSVPALFEIAARRFPDRIAVTDGDAGLSYGELARRAQGLARRLRRAGVRSDDAVAIAVDRSLARAVGVLGILAAGAAYVPLDLSYPEDRLAMMLEDSGARILLTRESLRERLPPHRARVVEIDGDPAGDGVPLPSVHPLSLAFILFTSGSTGRPKGVAMDHASLVNLIAWHVPRDGALRTLQFSTLSFDASFHELFTTWYAGGTVVMITEEMRRDPRALLRFVVKTSAERIFQPFVALSQLAEAAVEAGEYPPSLRRVITAGEQLQATEAVRELFARVPGRLENHYGPTETHVVTALALPRDTSSWAALPSIGRPLPAVAIYLLDRRGRPAAVTGELYAGGVQVARGYRDRPGLTAERFLPDPYGAPGGRMYRTGDLARWSDGGEVEFLGRIDFQLKIRGFRVEPGEVEVALIRHEAVREAAVVARRLGDGPLSLVAYLVFEATGLEAPAAGGKAPGLDELRAFLSESLPDYMVPAAFVELDALPLSPAGKVDRRALPEPDVSRPRLAVAYRAPRGPAEDAVAAVWAGLLGLDEVGVDDNFFTLGGHSLLATRVMARLEKVFRVEIPLVWLFERPTVAALTARVAGLRDGMETLDRLAELHARASSEADFELLLREAGLDISSGAAIERRGEAGRYPLSFTQERLWIQHQRDPHGVAYNLHLTLRLRGRLDLAAVERAVQEIERRHETLRTVFVSHDGVPEQVASPFRPRPLPRLDLEPLAAADIAAELRRQVTAEARRPFDLESGPVVRFLVLRFGPRDHALLLTAHHIIADGWSLWVLTRELDALYGAFSRGRPSPLDELEIQYGDFARWQHSEGRREALGRQLDYWRRQLAGAPERLRLPTDRPRPASPTSRGGTRRFELADGVYRALDELCRQAGATLFMGMLAAFDVLLRHYTGQDDLVVGTDIANRNRRELEGLIGFFVNNLALRCDLSGDPSFRELLDRVRTTTLEAYANQDAPFFQVVEAVRAERDRSYHPLFQVLLVLHNFSPFVATPAESRERDAAGSSGDDPGLAIAPLPVHSGSAKFDLTLYLSPSDAGVRGLLEYNADLWDESTMVDFLDHYSSVLEQVVADPDAVISTVTLAAAGAPAAPVDAFDDDLLADFNDDLEDF